MPRPGIWQRTADYVLRQADKPWGWWPFPKLRPKPEQRMTTLFVLKVALVYGAVAGGIVWVMVSVLIGGLCLSIGTLPDPLSMLVSLPVSVAVAAGASVIVFAPVYRLTLGVLWNRRARAILEMPPQPPPSPLAYENLAFSSDRPEDLP